MKRIFVIIALSLMCTMMFVSCTSKEQKIAVEYLKETMKSPSSFKVVEVTEFPREAETEYDTIYHISKVNLDKSYHYVRVVKSVVVDSIKIMRIEYPAYIDFFIEYDAANSFGAIIRDRETIIVCNGEAYSATDFYGKYMDAKVLDHEEAYSTIIEPRGVVDDDDLKVGNWLNKYDIGLVSRFDINF